METPVSSITLNLTQVTLKVSNTLQLTAQILPETATNKEVAWISSEPTIAAVDEHGNVEALALGKAVITCSALDGSGVSAQCEVTVAETAAESVMISADGETTHKATETVQLSASVLPETTTDKTVSWMSDKPDVATVNETGLVTAVSVGEAVITATNSAGQTVRVTITVVETPAESIRIIVDSLLVMINGERLQLRVRFIKNLALVRLIFG